MGLFRLLFIIALALVIVWLWRRLRSAARPAPRQESTQMVRCAHCRLHLPMQQALREGPHWYCSQAHLQRGPRD